MCRVQPSAGLPAQGDARCPGLLYVPEAAQWRSLVPQARPKAMMSSIAFLPLPLFAPRYHLPPPFGFGFQVFYLKTSRTVRASMSVSVSGREHEREHEH